MDNGIIALNKMGWLRAGGYTRRYHGWRTIKDDTVGQHSYNVTNIILVLRPDCRKELVVAGVRHDSPEHVTGDMPADTKRRVPGAKAMMDAAEEVAWADIDIADPCLALTDEEYRVMKLADYFDGMMFSIQERSMGNQYMDIVFERYSSYMHKMLDGFPPAIEHEIFEALQGAWVSAGGPAYVRE